METNAEAQPMFSSYRQAQVLSGLSRGRLWGLVSSDTVAASKIGSRVLIRRESLIRYLESQSYTEAIRQ